MATVNEYVDRSKDLNPLVATRNDLASQIKHCFNVVQEALKKLHLYRKYEVGRKIILFDLNINASPGFEMNSEDFLRRNGPITNEMAEETNKFIGEILDHTIVVYEGWREELIKKYNELINYHG